MAWLYLFVASIFEIAWTICVKFLSVKKVLAIQWLHFFSNNQYIRDLAPLLGYIAFGIANIVFFSMAIKHIPMSTAVAVWMGTALVGLKLIDIFVFKQGYGFYEVLFCALILVGVIGLRSSTKEAASTTTENSKVQ